MKKEFLALSMFASLLAGLAHTDARALTAAEIVEKSEKAVRGDTQKAIMQITVKTRRWTRTMTLKSYENRIDRKSFAEITAPLKDAGNRFLLIDKNMWQYVPKLQQTIRISPSMMLQAWMGSDFSNDDIVKESSILEDYTHSLIGRETIDGFACYRIELDPKPKAAVVWGKIMYFARESDCLPVREEYYNEHGVMKKFLTFGEFKEMHGRVIPTLYRMQSTGKTDKYTLMRITDALFNIPISENVFSLQNLTRR